MALVDLPLAVPLSGLTGLRQRPVDDSDAAVLAVPEVLGPERPHRDHQKKTTSVLKPINTPAPLSSGVWVEGWLNVSDSGWRS
jgi:hypothetical protein